ncbi:DNA repair ATPase [Rosistilla oblonga]|uniref:DNA repair ATPase n=1 Tax=Rosistilla oblonga TaxID=2527990 RepID=UPI003A9769C7
MSETKLAAGTYEILRNRMRDAAGELRSRLDQLNADRSEVFGNIDTVLLATERITTEHNCVPRDLLPVGKHFLFGYNVQFGLKTETHLNDVFAVYRFEDHQFHEESLELIGDERFERDFHEIYRYYKGAAFAKFFQTGPFVHMVFRVGKNPSDIKTFKWRIQAGQLQYIDNRSDHEVRYPPQHEFLWKRTTRDQHVAGVHPHISIEDQVFVETVGGDLTIKVENSTQSGRGIYAEPVDNADQTLDDAETYYALLGNLILLKILPYQERNYRYLLYNAKIQKAMRLDAIEHSCVLLPDDHGIIFPDGYYLQTGEYKIFDHGLTDLIYEKTIAAPNGEDFIYLFYNRASGAYVQLRYNLIRQQVETPLVCHGQAFFHAGEMVCFKGQDDQPQKHHALQIWQTPFVGSDFVPDSNTDSLLYKIGNKELVRGMAECHEILQLVEKDDSYEGLYVDLVKKTSDILDSYFWLDKAETHHPDQPLRAIGEASKSAVEEFEKVVRLRRETEAATVVVEEAVTELLKAIDRSRFEAVDAFVTRLAELRTQRGHAIGLRELRYVDEERIEKLESQIGEQADRLSRRCVEFMLSDGALEPYEARVEKAAASVQSIEKVTDAKRLEKDIDEAGSQLELLTETVSNLQIEDTTKRTEIIDGISDVFASLNRVRSALKARMGDLVRTEGRAEFASQLKLLDQTVNGYLDVCDSPEKCDNYLTKVMVQLEELEGRFAEFDEFVGQLAEKREELYNAFESRKVQLVEARNRRAEALGSAADRILKGIASRMKSFDTVDTIHAYFAADLMVEKVRGIVNQLTELDDTVRIEDIQSRLKSVREDAIRQLKDRQELFVDGGTGIKLGKHQFGVNTQTLDLTTVMRNDQLNLHLTGTQFFEPLSHPDLDDVHDLMNQEVVSENRDVYRGEYLAYALYNELSQPARRKHVAKDSETSQDDDAGEEAAESNRDDDTAPHMDKRTFERLSEAEQIRWVQQQMSGRYSEGYAKGVHDHDAAKLLAALLKIDRTIGLAKHRPGVRAAAWYWWSHLLIGGTRKMYTGWIGGFQKLAQAFPQAQPAVEFRARLTAEIADDPTFADLFADVRPEEAAAYLFDQLVDSSDLPVVSRRAARLYEDFCEHVVGEERQSLVAAGLKDNAKQPAESMVLARNWSAAFLAMHDDHDGLDSNDLYRDELARLLIDGAPDPAQISDAHVAVELTNLAGAHRRINKGQMTLRYHDIFQRLGHFTRETVPRFQRLHDTKQRLVDEARDAMKLEEFRPRVLTSFVRNRLLDEVYLPMIGDNLAKQIGVAGEGKRTDRMGLLLLISPPGYGKTTLMEYIANRLGIIFMKINGPAIGHGVTSLDPSEAPNAAAREEIERLNLALEMGDNVMLYLDDIQHTHPELLQKFISLCDATRKIEGVWKGKTRTYDFRGRRVAVVMAGNPYTESGDRFQIPDMLSNRADVYNLGEIIGDSAEAFEMSYLENCLTSNTALQPLASASPRDARTLIRAATLGSMEGIDLESNLSMDQVREMYSVLRKLIKVRDVVLRVNRQYIRSAAQADAYRTEPPFKLQGSYRNMNRIAEKVVAVMNDRELQSLIVGNYEQDSQTLTTDNESNVLKFKELMGILTPEEAERWEAIKYAFSESVRFQGLDSGDQVGQLMKQLGGLRDGLESIRRVMVQAVAGNDNSQTDRLHDELASFRNGMLAVGQQLSETLGSTSTQLTTLAQQNSSGPPPQKVMVQHKVPRVMLDVVKTQFQLMQQWIPLLTAVGTKGPEYDNIAKAVDACLKDYQRLQEDLMSAAKPGKAKG